MTAAYYLLNGRQVRPGPIAHKPLPAWDLNDGYGDVHTIPPPGLVIPAGYDNMFVRADFAGLTLDPTRWGNAAADLAALNIQGANSTPYTMLMSPMLILYPRKWQDAWLTESAERNYSHVVITGDGWNFTANGFNPTPAAIVQWAQYVASWGNNVIYWASSPVVNDPVLAALVAAHAVDWVVPGEEVDSKVTAQQYAAVLDNTLSVVGNGIPVGAHMTGGFPLGFPRDTFFDGSSMPGFDHYDGRVHLMWQAIPANSAGLQAFNLYEARVRVALGGVAGSGNLALNSRVIAFETMAEYQLFNECTEEYCCLRSLELLYDTVADARIPPMAGSANGLRLPSGLWV